MTTRKYSSRSQQTTLAAGITDTATSCTVVSGSALLGGATVPAGTTFTVVIDPDTALEEIVDVTVVSTNVLTITRGVENAGTGQAHSAGAAVRHMAIGRDFREANLHIEATGGYNDGTGAHTMHGIAAGEGVVVGTDKSQTLTNKILTSPTITNPSISGAGVDASIVFEGATADAHETTLTVVDPTQDNTITLPNTTGTVVIANAVQTLTNKTMGDALNAGGFKITNLATPTLASDAVRKDFADAQVAAAATSAASAATSAASAATSASSALTSANSASASQTAAATSAASAATSASTMAASVTAAAASATAAATSATSAAASATAAATSATSASASATAASTSATSAAASATAAATSATSAAASATASANSATASATSATASASSASAAATSASSALTSQTAAATSATSAAASATAAATSATSAAASATAAATSATSAAASATAAAGYVVPSQTGNAGEFLGTNGSAVSWTNTISGPSAASVPLIVKGAASQSADLLQLQNSTGGTIGSINQNGNLVLAQGIGSTSATIELGPNRTADGNAYIDFISDTTYTDYGLRIIRASGANGVTQIIHRGTGGITFTTQEVAAIGFQTQSANRLFIDSVGKVSIGTSLPSASDILTISLGMTGSASAQGVNLVTTIASDVTTNARGFNTFLSTAAAAFTLGNLVHYRANQNTIGAGSTVGSQIGFAAEASIVGATNNYGFYGAIPAGTGDWNFYAGGTAANYFAGRTGIGAALTSGAMAQVVNTTAADVALVVKGAASQSGDLLQIQNSASTVLVEVDSAGNVGIGTSAPATKLHTDLFSAAGVTAPTAGNLVSYAGGGNAASAGFGVFLTNDNGNKTGYFGADRTGGDAFNGITAAATSNHPMRFLTNNTERMRVSATGDVGIGTTTPAAKLDVNGSANFTNFFAAGKNKVLNGDFAISQRGTSFTYAASGRTLDRWDYGVASAVPSGTVTQETFTPGAAPVAGYEGRNFFRSNVTATNGCTLLQHSNVIEDVRTLAGQTATISYWVRADATVASAFSVTIQQYFGTGGSGSVNTSITPADNGLTSSWVRKSVTFTVPSISGKTIGTGSALSLIFNLPIRVGTFDMWGLQLEAGSVATPFTTATGNPQAELAACHRYYWRANTLQQIAGAVSTTIVDTIINPPTMRQGAVSHEVSGGGVYSMAGGGTPSYTSGTWSIVSTGPNYSTLRYTHGSAVFTAGTLWQFNSTYFALSAEL
jgi:hypothetical protein